MNNITLYDDHHIMRAVSVYNILFYTPSSIDFREIILLLPGGTNII
jgi:hypothetical protein